MKKMSVWKKFSSSQKKNLGKIRRNIAYIYTLIYVLPF